MIACILVAYAIGDIVLLFHLILYLAESNIITVITGAKIILLAIFFQIKVNIVTYE